MVYEETSGLYYDYKSGYYFDAERSLYYDGTSGTFYSYNYETKSYEVHSQIGLAGNGSKPPKRKKKDNGEIRSIASLLSTILGLVPGLPFAFCIPTCLFYLLWFLR